MPDKPILFSDPMVRALLDGRKSQTRRIVKPQPHFSCVWQDESTGDWWQSGHGEAGDDPVRSRYAVGDRLYVREAWRCRSVYDRKPGKGPTPKSWVVYEADAPHEHGLDIGRLRPSIHMPRWASRLTLTVTEVRCQRLQDISEEDAVAEGLRWEAPTYGVDGIAGSWHGDPRTAFAGLWNSIHGPDAWAANPWVFAYSVTVERGNIDALKAA